jgi:NTE family protein
MTSAPRVALVLGSGGARGYAHIGVINELRDRGYDIVGVSGSSMGALVGGLHAAGRLDEFTDWATSLTQGAVLRLLDPSFSAAGMLRAEKILDTVRDILGDSTIEDLPIPYTAIATDLVAGRSVWLQRGPVDVAIRASIAIPGLIAPHVVDGRLLADGGILDALPMAAVAAVNADVTIAVSLSGTDEDFPAEDAADDADDDAEKAAVDGEADEPGRTAEWLNRMLRRTSALLDTNAVRSVLDSSTAKAVLSRFGSSAEADDSEPAADGQGVSREFFKLGSFEVMNRSIDIAQAALTRNHLAMYPPDRLIEVPRTACRSLDFHRAGELIDVGRELTARALDAAPR